MGLEPRGACPEPRAMEPVAIGILGCGHVSDQYLRGCSLFDGLRLDACADIDVERARRKADQYGIPKPCSPSDLLVDAEVELVVNLTPPLEHARVTTEAIRRGKHVWSEKPLAATPDEARMVLAAARECDRRVGCAPDTFLAPGLQTAARLVEDGWIGDPVAAVAFVSEPGYEHFHPAVDAFYGPAGGPALDLGPYYLTALVAMLGPVERVAAVARATFPHRTIPTGARRGERIPVEVPTHVAGVLELESGVPVNLLTSWDIWSTHLPYLEVYGSDGSVSLPNPDEYDGLPQLRKAGAEELRQPPPPPGSLSWATMPPAYGSHVERGIGVADMAHAIRTEQPHRAGAELAYHVLEVLTALSVSSRERRHVEIESRCERPVAVDPGDGWLPTLAAGPACA